MLVLDTSALSGVMHRDPVCLERLERHPPEDVLLCAPAAAEIAYGLALLEPRTRRRRLLEAEYARIRDAVTWVDWTEDAAVRFGAVKAELRRKGRPADDLDVAIASIALSRGAALATRNVRHFAPIHGLAVDDWTR